MKRRGFAVLLAVLLTMSLAACGGSGGGGTENAGASSAPVTPAENGFSGGSYGASYDAGEPEMDYASGQEAQEVPGEVGDKIIHTAYLELETTEFEEAAASMEGLVEDMGGYFESSSMGNRGSGYRWADYTVRVPAEHYRQFLNRAGELCHETWRNTQRENVSEAYYDTAGRLRTQQIKLERLQALLAEADNMADIITIESAISETEWMIDELSGTLRYYDARVDYATVNITLQEVYRLSNVDEPVTSFAGRLGTAFSSGLRAFGGTLEDLTIALAYGWIWVVLLVVIVLAAVRILRRRRTPPKTRETADGKPGDDKFGEL